MTSCAAQELATSARLRYLSQARLVCGGSATFELEDGGSVRACTVAGVGEAGYAVRELHTPLGIAAAATLRMGDVAAVVFDVDVSCGASNA
jgi:hypothetical protein